MPGSKTETWGRFCDGFSSDFIVFCWFHYYSSWPNYCKGIQDRLGNRAACDPDVIFFQIMMQFFKMTMTPFTQLELFRHGLKSMKVNFDNFSNQHNH
jgi:hypothetical protein